MPRTLSAIPHFSPRPANPAAVKVLSQPLKDDKTFASLLGAEKPAKAGLASKKLPSGAASSQAKTHDDVVGFSQSGGDKAASSQADTSLASNAATTNQNNQAQFIQAGVQAVSLASYLPISGQKTGVSLSQSSPSAEANVALQASRPLPQPAPATKGSHRSAGATVTTAQDTHTINGTTQTYETAGDKPASHAQISVGERTTTAAAVTSSATGTAAISLKTPLASDAPVMDRASKTRH